MPSPPNDARIEPHKKAHFSLHISDQIARHDASIAPYSTVKYNHKPTLTADKRTTRLAASDSNTCSLKLEDTTSSGTKHVFTFIGQAFAPKKSYVLLFDSSSQQATLEPLSTSYTFNLASRNSKDVSAQYPKIYPKKNKEESQAKDQDEHPPGFLVEDDEGGSPDSDNPYDFRHFLSKEKEKEKRGDESEYYLVSSPDYRTATGSAANTPQFGAARPTPAQASKPKASQPASKKRKTAAPNPLVSKTRKAQSTPAVRLQRRATDRPPPDQASKSKGNVVGSGSKIVSAEFVHSSDDSDTDADGEAISSPPAPVPRSPSPMHQPSSDNEDESADRESDGDGGLEIEVPDARPTRRSGGALASLGLGQNLGVGYLRSPSNGPISLASATNSAAASPSPHTFTSQRDRQIENEIDFGDFGDEDGEDDEGDDDDNNQDIEPMDIGPPARQGTSGHDRKASMAGVALEDDEDDLEKMMMAGLAGGDSSEESEEE